MLSRLTRYLVRPHSIHVIPTLQNKFLFSQAVMRLKEESRISLFAISESISETQGLEAKGKKSERAKRKRKKRKQGGKNSLRWR